QRLAEHDLLLIAAREVGDAALGLRRLDAQPLDDLPGLAALVRPVKDSAGAEAGLVERREGEVLAYRPGKYQPLTPPSGRVVDEALGEHAVRPESVTDRLAVELDRARERLEAEAQPPDLRLPRADEAGHTDDLAAVHLHRDVLNVLTRDQVEAQAHGPRI